MDRLVEFARHHPLLAAAVALASVLVIAYEMRLRAQTSAAISPQDLIRLMNQGALVLDVRGEQLYVAGHISGSKPLAATQIEKAAETYKRYREKPVIVYDERGSGAAAAVRQLAAQGFTKAFCLRGGLEAWRAENLPVARA
jgi:rhodanese-related sulfurtransferase